MEVNALKVNNVIDSTPKVSTRTSKDSSNFNTILNKTTASKDASFKNQVQNNNDSSKKDVVSVDKNTDDSKPVPQEVKDALKKAGMSDEEINSIKSVKDLKNVLAEKILEGGSDEKVDSNNLLSILLSLLNGNIGSFDMTKLKEVLNKKIEDVVYENISKFSDLKPTKENINQFMLNLNKDLKNLFKDNSDLLKLMNLNEDSANDILKDIMPELKNALSTMPMLKEAKSDVKDIISKVQSQISGTLKESLNNLKAEGSEVKSSNDDILAALKLSSKNSSEVIKPVENSSQNNSEGSLLKNNDSSQEDSFLKNLVSDKDDSKISKAANFMSQFNNIKVDNNFNVSEFENVIVNKNTFNTDMIKALKYMDTNNMKNLTVKIVPKELGEVVIRLTMEAGIMKANITAANKDAYNLLNSNLQDITDKLQNNDTKIQSLSLNVYNEDTTFFKDGSQKEQSSNHSKNKQGSNIDSIGEDNGTMSNESVVDNNVNILA